MMLVKFLMTFILVGTSLCAFPQAVIFDFGGVMTGESNSETVADFLRSSLSLSEDEFQVVNARKRTSVKNGMTDVEFWQVYAKERRICLPENWNLQFKEVMKKALNPNPAMYELVDRLKQNHVRVGMLSNIDKRLAAIVRDFGLYEPFDPCLLSYEIGVEKPNDRAYTVLLSTLRLPTKDAVFIDDNQENVVAAKKLGVDAI